MAIAFATFWSLSLPWVIELSRKILLKNEAPFPAGSSSESIFRCPIRYVPRVKKTIILYIFLSTSATFVTFTHGIIGGWLSPALLVLNSEDTPLESGPMTAEEISWLASSLCIGGAIGVVATGIITSRFGNRIALMVLALPQIVSEFSVYYSLSPFLSFSQFWWICVIFANSYVHLVVGRAVTGLTGGALFRVLPNFVSEIAESE